MELKNSFRYSYSRGGLADTCLRKYFFRYYFHWNGWSYNGDLKSFLNKVDFSDTPSKKRWAYIAGKAQNVYSYTGNALHEAVEGTLFSIKKGEVLGEGDYTTYVKNAILKFKADLEKVLDEQATLSFLEVPKGKTYFQEFLNSSSYIYGFGQARPFYTEYFIKQALDIFKLNMVNYFRSGLYKGLVNLHNNSKVFEVEKEYFHKYTFNNGSYEENVNLSVKPDLFTISNSNRLSIFDWKTGSLRNIKMDQLQYYAYLFNLFKDSYPELQEIESYALKVYCLKEQAPIYEDFKPEEYNPSKLHTSLRKMSLLTSDGLENNNISDDREEEFTQKIDKGMFGCKACPFLKICKGVPEKLGLV